MKTQWVPRWLATNAAFFFAKLETPLRIRRHPKWLLLSESEVLLNKLDGMMELANGWRSLILLRCPPLVKGVVEAAPGIR